MTIDVTDMSTPVTRGELREELAQLESRIKREFDTKLDLWAGALRAQITESEKRVVSELARHTQAVFGSMTTLISVVDENIVIYRRE